MYTFCLLNVVPSRYDRKYNEQKEGKMSNNNDMKFFQIGSHLAGVCAVYLGVHQLTPVHEYVDL